MIEIFIGMILGALAGLGVGGGTILVLWLTEVIGATPLEARSINLMFFIIVAAFVSIFRIKNGKIDTKKILPGILAGSVTAVLFSWIGNEADPELTKKLFGVLLLITGFRELSYRPRNAK